MRRKLLSIHHSSLRIHHFSVRVVLLPALLVRVRAPLLRLRRRDEGRLRTLKLKLDAADYSRGEVVDERADCAAEEAHDGENNRHDYYHQQAAHDAEPRGRRAASCAAQPCHRAYEEHYEEPVDDAVDEADPGHDDRRYLRV